MNPNLKPHIARMKPLPPSVVDTLTVAEMGLDLDIERAMAKGFLSTFTLQEPHRLVYLRVGQHQVVRGWLSLRFKMADTNRTFWTWDRRFAHDLALGGTMPGLVEPSGWCEIE